MQRKSNAARITLALLAAMLLNGCASVATFGQTEATICRELRRDLPSYSARDTQATLDAGAKFIEIFEAVCK